MGWAAGHWSRIECRLMMLPREPSYRQLLLLVEEELVQETRQTRLDFHARAKFVGEGEPIHETRSVVGESFGDRPEKAKAELMERSADALAAMMAMGAG